MVNSVALFISFFCVGYLIICLVYCAWFSEFVVTYCGISVVYLLILRVCWVENICLGLWLFLFALVLWFRVVLITVRGCLVDADL